MAVDKMTLGNTVCKRKAKIMSVILEKHHFWSKISKIVNAQNKLLSNLIYSHITNY